MKAVILSGGFGTRLRPLTVNTPKSMVPVLNIPFLEYFIKRLKSHKVSDITLAVSYLAEPIKDYFEDGSRFDVNLSYTIEDIPLGTAGAVKNAGNFIDEPTLVFNGDIFTDLDLTAMMDEHQKNNAMLTIALTPVDDPTSYGLVETDSQNRILRFLEKPNPDDITTNMINAGTYIIEPEVMSLIPSQTNCSFERDIFPLLLREKKDVFAYTADCYWMDIGKPENYFQLHYGLLNGIICTIGEYVQINGPVVIGPNCLVSNSSIVDDCILWKSVHVEPFAKMKHTIIASNSHIGSGSIIEGAVLGSNTIIGYGQRIKTGRLISPNTIVSYNNSML